MIPLAAVAALLVSAAASAAPVPAPAGRPDAYARVLERVRQSFLTQQPGQPTLDLVSKLPPSTDPAQAQNDALVRSAISAAKEVQLGCDLPCTSPADIQLYRGKVELVASRLGLKKEEVDAAREHYLPKERPRLRSRGTPPASGEANQEVERLVMARLLLNNQLAPKIREELGRKALAMADALGRTRTVSVGADGVAVFAGGQRRALTPQQIARLNAIPQTQASILRRLVSDPPPPPLTREQKQQRVLSDAEKALKDNPGRVRQAQSFWKTESQDKSSNFLWRGYAYFNRGLLAVSGLGEVEDSAARVGYVSVSDDVSMGRKAWEVTKLAGNSAMFAANFVGLGGAGKVVKGVEAFDKPIVVDGIRTVGRQTAELVAEHSGQAVDALKPALASGGRDFKAATRALDEVASTRYAGAFKVVRGRYFTANAAEKISPGMAEWIAKDSKIIYNPIVGEAHEFAHAHQMFVTRAAALDMAASRAGKTVAQLSPSEVAQALDLAHRFEQAHYAQFEAQALRSSGVLGLAPGADYAAKLAANGREITQAMMGNPEWKFSTAQKVFGSLSGLGHNQVQIGMSLLPLYNLPFARNGMQTIGGLVADAVSGPAAAAPPAGRQPH